MVFWERCVTAAYARFYLRLFGVRVTANDRPCCPPRRTEHEQELPVCWGHEECTTRGSVARDAQSCEHESKAGDLRLSKPISDGGC
jgi:hypothetical protein